jgi:hypothetical protein
MAWSKSLPSISEATDSLVDLPIQQFPFAVRLTAITIHMYSLIAGHQGSLNRSITAGRRAAIGALAGLSSPGMAYWMITCSVYLHIAHPWGECPHLPLVVRLGCLAGGCCMRFTGARGLRRTR